MDSTLRPLALALFLLVMPAGHARCLAQASEGAAADDSTDTGAQSAAAALQRAMTAVEEADYVTAEIELDGAARSSLSTEQLGTWLLVRALLCFADGRLGALEEALQAYASLPSSPPTIGLPGPVAQRIDELRSGGPVRLRASPALSRSGDGGLLVMGAEAEYDPGHLVRSIEVQASIDGGPFLLLTGEETLALDAEHTLRYWMVAHGPGGAPVAVRGSADVPTLAVLRAMVEGPDPGILAAVIVAGVMVAAGTAVLAWGASDNWWRGPDTPVILGTLGTSLE